MRLKTHLRRADVEVALLNEMPRFPTTPREPPLHKRLLVAFLGSFHGTRATNRCVVQLVFDQSIRDFITGRSGVKSGFERIINRPDLKARTHQLRHWLNTLAQSGGVEQALIAR